MGRRIEEHEPPQVIVIALGIYALYCPSRSAYIAHMSRFPDHPARSRCCCDSISMSQYQYVARLFLVRPGQDVTQFVAYEDLTPLNGIKFAEVVYEVAPLRRSHPGE